MQGVVQSELSQAFLRELRGKLLTNRINTPRLREMRISRTNAQAA